MILLFFTPPSFSIGDLLINKISNCKRLLLKTSLSIQPGGIIWQIQIYYQEAFCDTRAKRWIWGGNGSEAKNGKNKMIFRPGPNGPNASGWYGRLRGPILTLSVTNCDQLWKQCFHTCHFLDKIAPSYFIWLMLLLSLRKQWSSSFAGSFVCK